MASINWLACSTVKSSGRSIELTMQFRDKVQLPLVPDCSFSVSARRSSLLSERSRGAVHINRLDQTETQLICGRSLS